MKKIFLLSLAAALAFSLNARAQAFDGLAIGVGGGSDGLSFELATPLGDHIQLRAGYGLSLGLYKSNDFKFSMSAGGTTVTCPLSFRFAESDARLLFNIYPGLGKFHFTVGAYLGSSNFVKGTMTNLPAEASTNGLSIGGKTIYPVNNSLDMFIRTGSGKFAVKPYAGIGFGRPVSDSKTVTFTMDLGCMYQGKASVWFSGKDNVEVDVTNEKDVQSAVGQLSKYIQFMPVLNFHLYVNLF